MSGRKKGLTRSSKRQSPNIQTQKRKNQLKTILEEKFRPENLKRRFSRRKATENFKNPKDKNRLVFQLEELQELQGLGNKITNRRFVKQNQTENLTRLKQLTKNIARSTMKIRYAPYFNNIDTLKQIYQSKSTRKNIFPTESRVERLQSAAWNDFQAKKGDQSEFINIEEEFNMKEGNNNNNNNNNDKYVNTSGYNLKKNEKEAFNKVIQTKLAAQNNKNIFQFIDDTTSQGNGTAFLGAVNTNKNLSHAVDKLWGRHWKSGKSRYFSEIKDGTQDLLQSKEFNKHCSGNRLNAGSKGFYVHEHQAYKLSGSKCCSLFENGQIAHNLGTGAEKAKSRGSTCGYVWDGPVENDTFESAGQVIP